jgi:hypothetical protein
MRKPYSIHMFYLKPVKKFVVTFFEGVGANFTSKQHSYDDSDVDRKFIEDNIFVQVDRIDWAAITRGKPFHWEDK